MTPRPLARILTVRLSLMAALGVAVNLVIVGLYYGTDRRELEIETIDQIIEKTVAALDGTAIAADAPFRALFADNPDAYAYALVSRGGDVLDSMNLGLIPPSALLIYADDWVTRLDIPGDPLVVVGHEFTGRTDGLRMVFAMSGDPAGLFWRAFLTEFYLHVLLPMLPVVILLIGVNAILIRRGLAPLSRAAEWARSLRPGAPVPPPPLDRMPAEVMDLVETTKRALDRLTEALATESRHAAEAAHALRTPVAVLVARLDALPPGETTERLRQDLAALSRTVQQVLVASRADLIDVTPTTSVNLADLATSVTASLAPFAHSCKVNLSLDAPDAPVMAQASAEGVEFALSNLVENAILHGGPGAVEISVGPGPTIRVRDHGPGLPVGAGQRIFTPFWRGQDAAPGGAGLGLAIVERVQRAQGGQVAARTAEGGGAVFVLDYRPPGTAPFLRAPA
jgi:two-component system OmpR family sensor kinase